MYENTRPADFDNSRSAGDEQITSQFRLTDAVEVLALLKSLMHQSVLIHLSASNGIAYQTTVWGVDAQSGHMSFRADLMAPAASAVVEADEAVAVAYLDRVKVQFDVTDLMLVQGSQCCVLQARMPHELFRFQRRGAFRVSTIDRGAPIAEFRHPAIPDMMLALRVLDLSSGGCALRVPADVPMLQPGSLLQSVHLILDIQIRLEVALLLHHVTFIGTESGAVRLGCEMRDLSGNAQRVLQSYIEKTQKRRRMMALD